MCTFITAVLPAAADADAVAVLFRAHGRAFGPGAMYATRAGFLATGERAFYTTPIHCDCGTPVGEATRSSRRDTLDDMAARFRRKGWSEAKIARAVAHRAEAEARPPRTGHAPAPTPLAEWVALIEAIVASRATPSLGLYWDNVDGAFDAPPPTVRVRVASSSLDEAILAGMPGSVIHDFVR